MNKPRLYLLKGVFQTNSLPSRDGFLDARISTPSFQFKNEANISGFIDEKLSTAFKSCVLKKRTETIWKRLPVHSWPQLANFYKNTFFKNVSGHPEMTAHMNRTDLFCLFIVFISCIVFLSVKTKNLDRRNSSWWDGNDEMTRILRNRCQALLHI